MYSKCLYMCVYKCIQLEIMSEQQQRLIKKPTTSWKLLFEKVDKTRRDTHDKNTN